MIAKEKTLNKIANGTDITTIGHLMTFNMNKAYTSCMYLKELEITNVK